MTWKHPHSPTTKKFKIEPSVKKTMATVFWYCEASCCVNFSDQKQSKYCETQKTMQRHYMKGTGWLTTGVKILHDEAWPHTSAQTAVSLQKLEQEILQYPPESWPSTIRFLPLCFILELFIRKQELRPKCIAMTVVQYFTSLESNNTERERYLLRDLGTQANNTDHATAACWRS
jgi:hypothetical protein